jgi:putative FmdB family regulatory protein
MPTYDYRCDSCGHNFELFQSIKAEPEKRCPKCGADTARRVIGAGGGLIFKGSGFYITDYTRSKDYKDKSKSESGGAPSSTPPPSSGGSSESKPAGGGASSGTSGTSSAAA